MTCLRGASAVQGVLEFYDGSPARVLAVWEPVILTDIGLPSNATLELLSDYRVAQAWDPDRLLSDALYPMLMAMHREGKDDDSDVPSEPEVVWDFLGFYPAGVSWGDSPPRPTYAGFPVIETTDRLKELLSQAGTDPDKLTPPADALSVQPPSPAADPFP